MRRILILLAASILVLVLAFYGYQNYLAPTATPTPPGATNREPAAEIVSAEGTIVPLQSAALAFKIGGQVNQVHVKEGDLVKKGDPLARLDDTQFQKQIAQAEAAVTLAQKQLVLLQAGATQAERDAAQAALDAALKNSDRVRAGPTTYELAQLKAQVDNAIAALDLAQAAYDRIGGASNPYIALTPQAVQLQQATNTYRAALAAYDNARSHPTPAELAAAQAQIDSARAGLARLTPTKESLDVAQAQVQIAQAALETLKTTASDYVLTAPFDGIIAQKNLEAGALVSPANPLPAFVIGNVSKLRVETTDLAEVEAPKIRASQSVKVTLDAFPDKTFHGKVYLIAPSASDHRGDKVFRVWIDLDEGMEAGLRWGMTAQVEITVGGK